MATQYWHAQRHTHQPVSIIPIAGVSATALVIGRLLFGGYFIYAGLHHFTDTAQLATFAAARGTPFPMAAVLFSGALIVGGGLGVLTGWWPRVGSAMIALFLIGVTPVMHAFWADPAGPTRVADLGNFTKNIGLLGGALIAMALIEPKAGSLTEIVDNLTSQP